jgi:hypothetical protein
MIPEIGWIDNPTDLEAQLSILDGEVFPDATDEWPYERGLHLADVTATSPGLSTVASSMPHLDDVTLSVPGLTGVSWEI